MPLPPGAVLPSKPTLVNVAAPSVLPAVLVILAVDVKAGVLAAIGLLPVCLVGIAPQRRQRIAVGIVADQPLRRSARRRPRELTSSAA